ncbi:MAG: ampC [Polaromonas sp.]|nr:ampC [Polaromonas sp.]
MNRRDFHLQLTAAFGLGAALPSSSQTTRSPLEAEVNAAIGPLMREQRIAGMAVAVVTQSQRHFFNYGVASLETQQPVTEDTLFEIGSLSKTFTGLLGGYAQAAGKLSLNDRVSQHIPELAGSSIGDATLLDLATYTAGGLPLQVPESIDSYEKMVAYYRSWQPLFPRGTFRLYSNASIGLFGHLTASSLGRPFTDLLEQSLFPALGLKNTYVNVPGDRASQYAWGYRDDRPVRVGPGLWDAEAYGVKTGAADLLRHVELCMNPDSLEPLLQRAAISAQTGYYRVGAMSQGLGWEMYEGEPALKQLLEGNSNEVALKPHRVVPQVPAAPPHAALLVNKTGSTNGFGAYAAFHRGKKIGVVMLANRNYPVARRVETAWRLLNVLGRPSAR